MTTILTILTEGFADWETALLNAVAHSFYKVETKYATPGGKPVTSSGNMTVTPELALEAIDVADYDAIIVCGGTIWQSPEAPDMAPLHPDRPTMGHGYRDDPRPNVVRYMVIRHGDPETEGDVTVSGVYALGLQDLAILWLR